MTFLEFLKSDLFYGLLIGFLYGELFGEIWANWKNRKQEKKWEIEWKEELDKRPDVEADVLIKGEVPSADVAEVRHGKWLWDGYVYDEPYVCNCCSTRMDYESNFCPDCGAYMRGRT